MKSYCDFILADNNSRIDSTDLQNSLLVYQITRLEVEMGFVDRLLYDMRPTSDNPLVYAGPGKCIFSVIGYDDDPRELFEIPQFVSFVRKANEFSPPPCWIYFSHPGFRKIPASRWLSLVAFCSINNASTVRQSGVEKFHFALSKPEISDFLARQMTDFNAMCSLANVRGREIKKCLSSVRKCLGI